jgi:hypothetical protein
MRLPYLTFYLLPQVIRAFPFYTTSLYTAWTNAAIPPMIGYRMNLTNWITNRNSHVTQSTDEP